MNTADLPVLTFEEQKKFHDWLDKNHENSDGIWLKFYKKVTGIKTIVYAEAVDEALCYGWIDSLTKRIDDKSYIQKFTPRRAKSVWSKINTLKVERLIKTGRMKKAGQLQIDAAKADGRWEKAYDSQSAMIIPEDFIKEVNKNKKTKTFFETLNKTNLYAIGYRLQTAKRPETREKRMKEILEMLTNEKKFH